MKSLRRTRLGVLGVLLLAVVAAFLAAPAAPDVPLLRDIPSARLRLGLDLLGGTQLVYDADVSNVPQAIRADAVRGVRDVIERRVNAFGVAEPRVQTTGGPSGTRIIVELAGVKDADEAIRMIGETPQLDFREEGDLQDVEQIEGITDGTLVVWKPTALSGKHLKRADVSFNPQSGAPEVSLTFDGEGADLFEEITERNVGKRVGIFLDGDPITTPVVRQKITQGQAVITGDFSLDEAKRLVTRLNAGALPVPIELVSRATVGPSLGRASLGRSMVAGIIGLASMMLYLVVLYRLPGGIAAFALALYALLNVAVYKLLGVTLTLAGVAGFVLSIGMAVDANILIFERLKEELRAGRPFPTAVGNAFREAWESIRDSNVSSLITSALLYGLGSSVVRGFALTLGIGILLSMFSAITVTRTVLRAVALVAPLTNPRLLAGGIAREESREMSP